MSDFSRMPWSDDPNAPQILQQHYFSEKALFAGNSICALSYGIAMILFFQCMGALLNPISRTRAIKWGLVAHTAVMFSALTVNVATSFDSYSISYIDNREFPGKRGNPFPGPIGYQLLMSTEAIYIAPDVMFYLNSCLADGFLLYRCYVIYSMNYWVIFLPCLMYLASLASSIVITYYQASQTEDVLPAFYMTDLEVPYFSVSLSLNVLLTLMIATRLLRHSRNIRKVIGPGTDNGLYSTVVTVMVESCVLYAVASLLLLGSLGAGSSVEDIFTPGVGNIQVIASYLIILRAANRTALTPGDAITSRRIDSIRFGGPGESTDGTRTLPDEDPVGSIGTNGETLVESGVGAQNIIMEVPSQ